MMNESYGSIPGIPPLVSPDSTKVTVCVEGYTFTGKVHHMAQQRILDALNKGIVTGHPRASKAFLQITEAEVLAGDGRRIAESTTSYIGKQSILFVIDREGGQRRSEAVKRQLVGYPIRSKKQVRVKIQMPGYTITGTLYTENWQKLDHLLESEDDFLPVTDVTVSPAVCSDETTADFVAINRAHVIFVLDAAETK